MSTVANWHSLYKPAFVVALAVLCSQALAQDPGQDTSLTLHMTGSMEAGFASYALTNDYAARHTSFVRGEFKPDSVQRWTGELANITEFGDTGTLMVVGYERTLDRNWIVQGSAATSDGGATLPRLRFDLALGHKWLENANLVTTLGVTAIQAKDAHSDHAVQLSTAYYFDAAGQSWSVEGGVRNNISNPGAVNAGSFYAAVTLSRPKVRTISLRLGGGQEGYQLVGDNTALVNFDSNTLLLTWREWLSPTQGVQWRWDRYRNPFYNSTGIEASWFWDF